MFFRVHELLGSGQFGSVHRAVWQCHGEEGVEVAVKNLRSGANKDDTLKFLQEAAIMAQFRSPNVVRMFGDVTDNQHQVQKAKTE